MHICTDVSTRCTALCLLYRPRHICDVALHIIHAQVSSRIEAEHAQALGRKEIIEKRKEEAERKEQEKARELNRLKAEDEARR